MNDILKAAFPELTHEQLLEILAAFDRWYEPRWMDHETKRDMLIGFGAGWMAREAKD